MFLSIWSDEYGQIINHTLVILYILASISANIERTLTLVDLTSYKAIEDAQIMKFLKLTPFHYTPGCVSTR